MYGKITIGKTVTQSGKISWISKLEQGRKYLTLNLDVVSKTKYTMELVTNQNGDGDCILTT